MIRFVARTFYRLVGQSSIPVKLGLRNIFILPTGYGFLFLLLLVAMLLGSINYNNNLGFLLTFLLGSIMLSSMMHTYGMLYGLQLVTTETTPTFAGEPALIEIHVQGNGRLRKGLHWSFSRQQGTEQHVDPTERTRVAVPLPTTQRGLYQTGPLRIHSEYPTGLFRAWSRIETNEEYLVYPKPISASLPVSESDFGTGATTATSLPGVDDFAGLNAYQPGDSPGRIHWPSFSRGQGLHVKTFTGLRGGEQVLNLSLIPGSDLERKLSILCYHILAGERQQTRFGLQLPGHPLLPPDTGRAHRNRCLRALALFTPR
ncbi:DUF58 domain-containing protein [Desulfobulbus rhabdoformis]|uniref:DUF58 domain-containing protein n=1 Tax=Desulfobulbus rhabdoformis TaxID=34032 RepID=UPI001963FF29|nr:DUF58 domain-containing protein [Desulfobulbus rhabdoformis]